MISRVQKSKLLLDLFCYKERFMSKKQKSFSALPERLRLHLEGVLLENGRCRLQDAVDHVEVAAAELGNLKRQH